MRLSAPTNCLAYHIFAGGTSEVSWVLEIRDSIEDEVVEHMMLRHMLPLTNIVQAVTPQVRVHIEVGCPGDLEPRRIRASS